MPLGLIYVRTKVKMVIFMLHDFLLVNLPTAYFHALIVETCCFGKTTNNKIHLSLQTLASEIKPRRSTIRVNLFLHSYFVSVHTSYLLYLS